MEKIKDLHKELVSLSLKINENYKELMNHDYTIRKSGGSINHQWNVLPVGIVDNSIVGKVLELGKKAQDLIKERDVKYNEFDSICRNEYETQMSRAKKLNVSQNWINLLQDNYKKTYVIDQLEAVENLKNKVDFQEYAIVEK